MNSIELFSPLVYKTNFPVNLGLIINRLNSLIDNVDTNAKLEKGGGISTAGKDDHPHRWHELEKLSSFVFQKSEEVWQRWGMIPVEKRIEKSWINVHPPGAYTDEHSHGDVSIVATVYLYLPKNSGFIEFRNPLEYPWSGYPKFDLNHALWKSIPCVTGDILLFPGWLHHRVQPNNSEEDRVVLTMNIEHRRLNVMYGMPFGINTKHA
jgi:uncharacterized protein (TIGR02466 family)